MSGKMCDYLQNALLLHVTKGSALAQPTHLYLALYTAVPGPGGGGTELAIGTNAYARVIVDAWTVSGNDPTQAVNTSLITFAAATPGGWGTILGWALLDAASGGNFYWYGDDLNQAIGINGVAEFLAGALKLTLD